MDEQSGIGNTAVVEGVRAGLLQLADSEKSVNLWLSAPHPMLDGASPQELIDSGQGAVVLTLVRHMLDRAPA